MTVQISPGFVAGEEEEEEGAWVAGAVPGPGFGREEGCSQPSAGVLSEASREEGCD